MSEAFGSYCPLACASRVFKVYSSEDEDDILFSHEHKVWTCFQEVVASDSPGMLVESFFEDVELARTAPELSSSI